MIKSVLILDEFFAMNAKMGTLFLSHINIVKYLTHRNKELLNCPVLAQLHKSVAYFFSIGQCFVV